MSTSQTSPLPATGSNRWLIGPASDLLLGCGVGYAIVLVGMLVLGPSTRELVPLGILPLALLVTGTPHYGATLMRVYNQRESRRRYAVFSVWITCALVLAFAVACYWYELGSWLVTIYFDWSPWHYAGQNYGIALMFLHRRGVPVPALAKRLLYISFIFSFLLTFVNTNGTTAGALYALDAAETSAQSIGPVYHFMSIGIPRQLQSLLMIAGLIVYLGAMAGAFILLKRNAKVADLIPSALLVATQSLWFVVPSAFRMWGLYGDTVPFSQAQFQYAFMWVAMGHSIQYLWITTYYARREPTYRTTPRYLVQCVLAGCIVWQLPTFVFAPAILGTVAYSDGLRMLVAAVVNLHHFVLDGAVWKLRDGRVASILLRSGASTGPDLGVAPHRPWLRPTVWAVGAVCFAIAFVSIWEREFGVRRAHANGDIERMRSAVSRLIAIGQDESAIHRNLGILAAREKQPQLALEELEKSLLLAEHPRAWFEIGHLYAGSRDWQRTVSAYEAAYAIDAKPEMLIGRLAGALMRLGDPDRAREVLLEGLLVHPGHSVLAQQLDNVEQRLRDRASDGDGNAGEGASVPGL